MDNEKRIDRFRIEVSRPDWFKYAIESQQTFLRLVQDGMVPQPILGWMAVTHCKRMLRAIYGSDQSVASALAQQVIDDMLDAQRQMLCKQHLWQPVGDIATDIAACEACGCVRPASEVCATEPEEKP